MSTKRKMALNLVCSLASFFTSLLINFILSPYIVKTIGVEANGFISLGNNFITYISLITIAISSMSARFVTVSVYEKKKNDAMKYYSSTIMANIFVVLFLILPSILLVINLDKFIDIPVNLLFDVKMLFALLITNFLINSIFSCFSISFYCKDSLYLQNIITLIGYFIRLISILILFIFFKPHIAYVAVAALIVVIYTSFINLIMKNRLMDDIKFDMKYVSIKYMWNLLKSGFWNSINTLGTILLTGLDLLIANVFLGSYEMGILALVKTIINIVIALNNQIAQVFYPRNTILYAEKKYDELTLEIKKEMKILSFVNALPIACLIVFGKEFFSLWQPTQNSSDLYILCLMSIYSFAFLGGMDVLWSVFTISNKLKWNSLLVIFSGIINTLIVIVMVKYTNYGLYAIAGISPAISLIRNIVYTLPFSAKYINQKRTVFFTQIFKSFINVMIFVCVGFTVGKFINSTSWLFLGVKGLMVVLFGTILSFYIVLNKEERKEIQNMIKGLVKKNEKHI